MSYKFEQNSCLLLIDIQQAYKDDIYGFNKFRDNVKKIMSQARKEKIPIIFIFELDNEKSKWIPFWEEMQGKKRIHDKAIPLSFTKPRKNEKYFIKYGFDAFFQTGLHSYLQSKKIKTIHFCGLLTGMCVLNSILSSNNFGYRNILVKNCCSDRTKKRHEDTIKNYENQLFIVKNI